MAICKEMAWAKVNLTLDVLGKRPDGYHDLKSVMQTITLCDEVIISLGTGKEWKLSCDAPGVPCDSRNLCWKAAEVFFGAAGIDPNGLEMLIIKRIPSQAGLGGGSADAAAVLRALNRHYDGRFHEEELADLGAKVGSDVPFCVLGGTAMAEGRGERLRKLKPIPDCFFVVVKPAFPVSTPALFRQLDSEEIRTRPDNDAMEQAILRGDPEEIGRLLYNVFEPVVARDHPEIEDIRRMLLDAGAMGCRMSGSGSACFGIAKDEETARRMYETLKKKYPRTYFAASKN